jgi:NAD(P) transhydrogenase
MDQEFDLVVIGTGPGGEGAAMQAGKQGKSVAVVERYDQVGGGCTHRGTIPTKSLRYMISRMTDTNTNPVFRAAGASVHVGFPERDTILDLKFNPQSVTIYGAGVVGCEYTSMFRNLNCKVNLINTRPKLLEFLDDEIIDALSYHMRDRGVVLRHNECYDKVTGVDDGVILSLKSGKQLKTDILLWANGRTGNTDDMGLETIGIQPNVRGQLDVNEDFQTKLPHIYGVGDVIGYPSLASAALVQGRYAAGHLFHGKVEKAMVRDIPTGIYTAPEISSVGRTERELTAAKIPYEIGHAQFKHLAYGQITGRTVGMLKLLFHRETLEILGVHCFGDHATEIVHIGQAIMAQSGAANSLLYFINTTFNYPTMAEAYRVAALNGYNRLF